MRTTCATPRRANCSGASWSTCSRPIASSALADALYADRAAAAAAALSQEQRLELRRELSWAAALHEVGMMVSHHDHHRHSAYVLAHADAAGFSQSQQRRLAELVLAQRGSLRKSEAALANEAFAWQVLCLRLAIIKCHARRPVDTCARSRCAAAKGEPGSASRRAGSSAIRARCTC